MALDLRALHDARQHHQQAALALVHHAPEVVAGVWQWALGCGVSMMHRRGAAHTCVAMKTGTPGSASLMGD
jgi:hypothetical protein